MAVILSIKLNKFCGISVSCNWKSEVLSEKMILAQICLQKYFSWHDKVRIIQEVMNSVYETGISFLESAPGQERCVCFVHWHKEVLLIDLVHTGLSQIKEITSAV